MEEFSVCHCWYTIPFTPNLEEGGLPDSAFQRVQSVVSSKAGALWRKGMGEQSCLFMVAEAEQGGALGRENRQSTASDLLSQVHPSSTLHPEAGASDEYRSP